MNPQDQIAKAAADFRESRATLERSLANTPDDRIDWSPSPSARTPLHIVAHAADSVRHLHNTFRGIVFPLPTSAEGDRSFREWEAKFTTREAALEELETNSLAYLDWLENFPPDQLATSVQFPYKIGSLPIGLGITFVPRHTLWHAAQIDYIQTIYGDRDWHAGF